MKRFIIQIKKTACWVVTYTLLSSMILTSCDSRLEEPVYDFWGEDFYSSTDRLNMGVRGILESFSSQDTYGMAWMVFDCDTDISHIKSPGTGHYARDIGHYTIYESHPWFEKAWMRYYAAIDRANFILAKKDEVVVEDNDRDRAKYQRLIAETRFMRALAYFDLVRLFGDVPCKESFTINGEDMKYSRTDKYAIYNKICIEMEDAIKDLPWHDEFPEYVGRFSKGAGHALLARVYLFRGGWSLQQSGQMHRPSEYKDYYAKVVEHADAVINSGKHGLNPSYETIFRNMCEYKLEPIENIYEFQFYSATAQLGGSSQMGTYNGPAIADGSVFGRATSFINTHNFFYDTFAADDQRKDVAVATWKIAMRNGKEQVEEIKSNQSYLWAPGKWRRNWHTGTPQDPNYTNVNWVFLRYADVLLMKVEAENELSGPTATAIEAMNQVRRRAYGKDPMVANADIDYKLSSFDQESLFTEIVAERARELCFEGHRRMDLIRWNMLGESLTKIRTQFDDAIAAGTLNRYNLDGPINFTHLKHELYPLPSREIMETGGLWDQNPGYNK